MTTIVYAFNNKLTASILLGAKKTDLLVSYYYLKQDKKMIELLDFVKERRNGSGVFMLDSGAFSAWNNGKLISLWEYIDYIKKYHSYFTHIVCLDVIDNPIYSEVNHLIMLKELKNYNLEIIPVFHSGESFLVLDYMVEKKYKYIGISPNNNWPEENKRKWLSRVFSRYDFEKLGIKTHGFGYQSIDGVIRFPLTSTDAITWRIAAGYGRIIDPVNPSVRYSDKAIGFDDHIDSIPGGDSQFTLDLCEELGITVEELRKDYNARNLFNIEALGRLGNREKVEMPINLELFEGGDNSDFTEERVLEVLELCKSKGRNYLGVPGNFEFSKKRVVTRGKKKQQISETIF